MKLITMLRRWYGSKDHHVQDHDERQAKINELRATIGPLSGHALKFCSDACLSRYLEARNWNVHKSKKMLEDTLRWRATYQPEEIRWDEVAMEGETGKVYRADFHDRFRRSVLILNPAKQNTTSEDNQLRHLVYLLENAIINLPPEQEQMVWLIDFNGWSLSNYVPVTTVREATNILQNHYPERLAAALLYNPPRIFEAFWKIVKYFLDSKTFAKVKFVYPKNEECTSFMQQVFDFDKLPTAFGGNNESEYNNEEFSKLMRQDDIKTAQYWMSDEKSSEMNGNLASKSDLKVDADP